MIEPLYRTLYYLAQSLRGEPVARVLSQLENSQRSSPDALWALQWERQRRLLRHAYDTVPFYRERMTAAGIGPGAIRSSADWQGLPVLEKRALQEDAAALTSSRSPRSLAAATSGSSGTAVAVKRAHLSWAHAHANLIRGLHWHGLDVGDRYAYLWGVPLDPDARRQAFARDRLFNRDRCSAFDLDRERARSFYQRQLRRPARWAHGYPSALAQFADELRALGLDGTALGWRVIVTTAEVLKPEQRERMVETFGCGVADCYGCAEVGIAGFECERGGLHQPIESVVVDLVPAEHGLFEALLTDLHNTAQPVIRYRVGDLVEPAASEAVCPCGRALPLLGRVFGRAGDTLELPDGRRINANLPSYIFKKHGKAGTVREYQFVQFPGGRVELRILPGPAWNEEVREKLHAEVRQALAVDAGIRVVSRFERRGRGKHRDYVKAEDLGEV